jgi:hypothetical protein
MTGDDRKTLPVLLGSRPAAVIRLRGWERVAYLGFSVGALVIGALTVANQLGASISRGIFHGAEGFTATAALSALAAFVVAIRRYDGETADWPDMSKRRQLGAELTRWWVLAALTFPVTLAFGSSVRGAVDAVIGVVLLEVVGWLGGVLYELRDGRQRSDNEQERSPASGTVID